MDWTVSNIIGFWGITIGIIVPFVIFIWQKRIGIKRLSYELLYEEEIIERSIKGIGKIQVSYKKEELKDLWIVGIHFINNGNRYIEKEDFEKPITIIFPKKTKIISVTKSLLKPQNLDLRVSINRNDVILEPFLLNHGDAFVIKIALTRYSTKKLKINARIKGLGKLTNIKLKSDFTIYKIAAIALFLMFIFKTLLFGTVITTANGKTRFELTILDMILLFTIILLIVWDLLIFVNNDIKSSRLKKRARGKT